MVRKNTEAEAIVARERRLLRQRGYYAAKKKRIREHFWTDERQRWLVNLFHENLPTSEIASRMGITKNAVIGRPAALSVETSQKGGNHADAINYQLAR